MQQQIVPLTVGNHLLRTLPAADLARLLSRTHLRSLPNREVLHRVGEPIDFVYFPEQGWVSLVARLDNGTLAEVGMIGSEGMIGMCLVFGIDSPFNEAMVQSPGSALCMTVQAFKEELARSTELRVHLLRYAETLYAQISQTAACNSSHKLEPRLARWLLMALDRTGGNTLPLTQEFLAMMLGVQRSSVTIIAGRLQTAELIQYANGTIVVPDREKLEAASCHCYRTVRDHSDRVLRYQLQRDVG